MLNIAGVERGWTVADSSGIQSDGPSTPAENLITDAAMKLTILSSSIAAAAGSSEKESTTTIQNTTNNCDINSDETTAGNE